MYSLHLTGSPWFLLLIPPGLWILWRQYLDGSAAGGSTASRFPRTGRILFALQAAAMTMLAVSLTAPELRRHRVEFHNPAILILRDQSASFRAGAYLGLGGSYREFEKRLVEGYRARKFDVRVADFAESAWPVSGFPRMGRQEARDPGGAEEPHLTSLAALADFVDSAAVPNLQAAFLFSDGRANLDSGRSSRTWRIPLFPVVFRPDSIAEIQPEEVRISLNPDAPSVRTDLEVSWRPVGKAGEGPSLKLLQGGKTLLTRKLPAAASPDAGVFRFPWIPEKPFQEGRMPVLAVVTPSDKGADFNPYNDTLGVSFPQGRAERVVHVFRPVRSLDEKGMLAGLQSWEGTRVSFFGIEDIGRLALSTKDQVWVEAGSAGPGRLQSWLGTIPAKVVVYSRIEPGRTPQVTESGKAVWRTFSPVAEIKPVRAAAEAFPDEVVRLKSLADASLDAPEWGGETLVEIREGAKRGMLMGRIPLGTGKRAFFFCLPAVWGPLFDPQGDFATRENIAAYVRAAQRLAAVEEGAVSASRPARAYHLVPFDVGIRLPEKREAEAGKSHAGPLVFSISGGGFSREWPRPEGNGAGEFLVKGIAVPKGDYRMELRAGTQILWSDSLPVAPKAALELARIGFDRAILGDAASRSGGRVLEPELEGHAPGGVTSMLPTLPGAQIRMEKTSAIHLYNTLAQCLFILALLSLSWFLRKKWDID
ncbi:MAG: hypothetical protein JWP91_500 [Fibrobacteres bacterium]|nr:hypothetical protein [Fibrobacterota bacterium]